jgi:glycerophosphoryl diester phosphodiesterase
MRCKARFLSALVLVASCLAARAQGPDLDFLNHNQPLLDAHNCYPYEGKWSDRIQRALGSGYPVSIEQDLAWYVDPATGKGRVVVSHTPKTTGAEPTLEDYFFKQVRPVVEKAIAENKRDQWPVIVLHFDFKDNQTPLLQAVWQILGEHQDWLSTAVKTSDPSKLSPIERKPILVVTEESDDQQKVFYDDLPVGARLRLFGSAHTHPTPKDMPMRQLMHWAVQVTPEELLSEPPTNYRRWWNSSWYTVEEGGEPGAGDWTAADDRRLRALVDHAHKMGYWVRFYTLDGFEPAADQGWGQGYNFGSREAVILRWKAAIAAGVNFIATNQYEALAPYLKQEAQDLRPADSHVSRK